MWMRILPESDQPMGRNTPEDQQTDRATTSKSKRAQWEIKSNQIKSKADRKDTVYGIQYTVCNT